MAVVVNGAASALPNVPYPTATMGPWGETSWWAPNVSAITDGSRGTRRVTLVDDPLGSGERVFRAELFGTDGAAITALPDSRRSELSQFLQFQTIGQTWWYRVRTLVPESWQQDDGRCPTTMWQVHDQPDAGDPGRGPPLEFEVLGDSWLIYSRSAVGPGNDAQVVRKILTGKFSDIVGRWQSWVVRATWSPTTAGSLTIWRNRRRIYEEAGVKNCFDDVGGLFAANGAYCPVFWPQQGIASRVAFNSGMVIGDSAETFQSFTGQTELERVMPVRLAMG